MSKLIHDDNINRAYIDYSINSCNIEEIMRDFEELKGDIVFGHERPDLMPTLKDILNFYKDMEDTPEAFETFKKQDKIQRIKNEIDDLKDDIQNLENKIIEESE